MAWWSACSGKGTQWGLGWDLVRSGHLIADAGAGGLAGVRDQAFGNPSLLTWGGVFLFPFLLGINQPVSRAESVAMTAS